MRGKITFINLVNEPLISHRYSTAMTASPQGEALFVAPFCVLMFRSPYSFRAGDSLSRPFALRFELAFRFISLRFGVCVLCVVCV